MLEIQVGLIKENVTVLLSGRYLLPWTLLKTVYRCIWRLHATLNTADYSLIGLLHIEVPLALPAKEDSETMSPLLRFEMTPFLAPLFQHPMPLSRLLPINSAFPFVSLTFSCLSGGSFLSRCLFVCLLYWLLCQCSTGAAARSHDLNACVSSCSLFDLWDTSQRTFTSSFRQMPHKSIVLAPFWAPNTQHTLLAT